MGLLSLGASHAAFTSVRSVVQEESLRKASNAFIALTALKQPLVMLRSEAARKDLGLRDWIHVHAAHAAVCVRFSAARSRGFGLWTIGVIGYILGLYRDNGKENGNYCSIQGYIGFILGLYRDNGKAKLAKSTLGDN